MVESTFVVTERHPQDYNHQVVTVVTLLSPPPYSSGNPSDPYRGDNDGTWGSVPGEDLGVSRRRTVCQILYQK